ncbi:MAG: uracil-DNA glycosylase family protein [Chitinophagales bacterium]
MSKSLESQADSILNFYKGLNPQFKLPAGVSLMNPYRDRSSWILVESFYRKYYSDTAMRTFIFGINPGRFGGGVTGIPFTDPVRLKERCGISHELKKLPELSSQFIYQMIDEFGGIDQFYGHFFISALCPLGFMQKGKNLNYYDSRELCNASKPFMTDCIRKQVDTMLGSSTCICLGEGENFNHFKKLNDKHDFFKKIVPLPHPRWIMQYRRKRLNEFVNKYVEALEAVLEK